MYTGKIKWFEPAKGYGFILPDSGGNDIYLHGTELQKTGKTQIADGQKVRYDLKKSRGKMIACDLEIIEE